MLILLCKYEVSYLNVEVLHHCDTFKAIFSNVSKVPNTILTKSEFRKRGILGVRLVRCEVCGLRGLGQIKGRLSKRATSMRQRGCSKVESPQLRWEDCLRRHVETVGKEYSKREDGR